MKNKNIWAFILLIGCFLSGHITIGQNTILLEIPGIEGNSELDEYEGWIDVDSYSYGISRPLNMGSNTSGLRTSPRASTQKFQLTIPSEEKAIPELVLATCDGTVYSDINLHFIVNGLAVEEILLKGAVVDGVSFSFVEGSEGTANVSIVFRQVEKKVTKVDAYTGEEGGTDTFKWDTIQNETF